jgi:hypothetical protein
MRTNLLVKKLAQGKSYEDPSVTTLGSAMSKRLTRWTKGVGYGRRDCNESLGLIIEQSTTPGFMVLQLCVVVSERKGNTLRHTSRIPATACATNEVGSLYQGVKREKKKEQCSLRHELISA